METDFQWTFCHFWNFGYWDRRKWPRPQDLSNSTDREKSACTVWHKSVVGSESVSWNFLCELHPGLFDRLLTRRLGNLQLKSRVLARDIRPSRNGSPAVIEVAAPHLTTRRRTLPRPGKRNITSPLDSSMRILSEDSSNATATDFCNSTTDIYISLTYSTASF